MFDYDNIYKERLAEIFKMSLLNFMVLGSVGAGMYHGLSDANGVPIDTNNLENILTYGPAALSGAFGMLGGIGAVAAASGAGGSEISDKIPAELKQMFKNVEEHGGNASLMAATSGGLAGAVVGGFWTTAGYFIGYSVGYLTK